MPTISFCQGKGSIAHNNREFGASNADIERTPQNITYINQSIEEAYRECFDDALRRYNDNQTRADRKINTSYFEDLFRESPDKQRAKSVLVGSNKQKSFYEDLVQIGTKDDCGVGSADGEMAAKCLDEYMRGFQERNPNFYVFNAVLHVDEATPHLHIDYIPIGHYSRGMDTQNGLARALEEMGYDKGKDAINRWRVAERRELEYICRDHGVEITEPQKARGYSLLPEEYKIQKDMEKEKLQGDIERLEAIYEEKERTHIKLLEDKKNALESKIEGIEGQLKIGQDKLDRLQPQIERAEKRLDNFEKGRKTRQSMDEIAKSGRVGLTGRVSYDVEQNKALTEYARIGSAAADRVIELERQLKSANDKLEPYEKKARAYDEIQKDRERKPSLEEQMQQIQIKRFLEIPEVERRRVLDGWQVKGKASSRLGRSGDGR